MNMKIPAGKGRQILSSWRWWEASSWDAAGSSLPLPGCSPSLLLLLQEGLPTLHGEPFAWDMTWVDTVPLPLLTNSFL